MIDVVVIPTGRVYGFNGTEYIAKYPNGDRLMFWSPPWGEMDEEEKMEGAVEYAKTQYGVAKTTRAEAHAELKRFFGEGAELEQFVQEHWPIHYA